MRRRLLTTTLVTSALLVLPTACGPSSGSSGQGTGSSNQTSTVNNTTANNATANNSTASGQTGQSGLQLQPFTDSQTGITVQVPVGWTQSSITGGDYTGWQFVNPKDSTQIVKIIRSSCVGCYELNGTPNPKQPIPEKNATNVTVLPDGLTATYDYTATGNSNPGMGALTVTKNSSGYGYVEVLLPASDSSIAAQILKSFTLKS